MPKYMGILNYREKDSHLHPIVKYLLPVHFFKEVEVDKIHLEQSTQLKVIR